MRTSTTNTEFARTTAGAFGTFTSVVERPRETTARAPCTIGTSAAGIAPTLGGTSTTTRTVIASTTGGALGAFTRRKEGG